MYSSWTLSVIEIGCMTKVWRIWQYIRQASRVRPLAQPNRMDEWEPIDIINSSHTRLWEVLDWGEEENDSSHWIGHLPGHTPWLWLSVTVSRKPVRKYSNCTHCRCWWHQMCDRWTLVRCIDVDTRVTALLGRAKLSVRPSYSLSTSLQSQTSCVECWKKGLPSIQQHSIVHCVKH